MSSVSSAGLRADENQKRTANADHASYSDLLSSSVSPPNFRLDETIDSSMHAPVAAHTDAEFLFTNDYHNSVRTQLNGTTPYAATASNKQGSTASTTGHFTNERQQFSLADGYSYENPHGGSLASNPNTLSPSPPSVFNHLSPAAAAGYNSDNGPSEISAHTTPSFDEEFLDVDFSALPALDDQPFSGGHFVNKQPTDTLRDTAGRFTEPVPQDKSSSLLTTKPASYLISPVNTNITSPSMNGEELNNQGASASLFPTYEGASSSQDNPPNINRLSLSTMQQTPALTGSSKSSSHDGNVRNPAHLTSPIVKVEIYSRDDSPSREMLQRSFSKRSQASKISTSHLHANFGDEDELDEDEQLDEGELRFTSRAGYDPNIRNEDEVPSLNEQEDTRQAEEKNAEVKQWLATSDVGSDAGGVDSPSTPAMRRKQKLANRRRAKSVGDPARTSSSGTGFNDSHVPGPGVLLDVDSEDDGLDDDDTDPSSWTDDQDPADIEENSRFEEAGDYFPTVEDEPLPSQFVRVRPWADAPFSVTKADNEAAQPPTANHAIMIFNRRAGDIDRSSRVATWGTRRLSETDVDKLIQEGGIFKRFSFNSKDKARKPERKGSGFLNNILQRVPSNKRRPSEKNIQLSQNRNGSEAGLAPPTRTPSFPTSFGRKQTKPNTMGGAVAAMTSSIAAVGASNTMNATPGPPVTSPWERGKQVIKRARSGSNLSISKKTSSEGLSSLIAKHGGPPVPNLASPSIDETGNRQLQAPPPPILDPEEDDDLDDDMADAGIKMELNVRLDPIIPTTEGFLTNVKQLNPRLSPFLSDRISHEQVGRYKRLVKLKIGHLNAVRSGSCISGAAFCPDFGGQAKILQPRVSQRETDTPFIGFQVNAVGLSDDEDQGSFGEGAVAPAQFPQGVPLPPTKRLPAEFECPLCFRVKKFQKPSDWTKHVHEDVQPFTCTWPRCTEPKSFKRKADWVRHENERHRKLEWWTCDIPECSHTCYRKDNFVQHLVREHKMAEPKVKTQRGGKVTKARGPRGPNEAQESWPHISEENSQAEIDKLWSLVERCRHDTTKKPKEEPCKFCGNVCSTWKKLTVHLARHMEQISLPVLTLVDQRVVTPDTLISPIGQPMPSNSLVSPITPQITTNMESLSSSPYEMTTNLPPQQSSFVGMYPSASPQATEMPSQFGDMSNQQNYTALPPGQSYNNTYPFAAGTHANAMTGYGSNQNASYSVGNFGAYENQGHSRQFMPVKQEDGYSSGNDQHLYHDQSGSGVSVSQHQPIVTSGTSLGGVPVSYNPQQQQNSYSGPPTSQTYGFDDGSQTINAPQMGYGFESTTGLAFTQAPSNPSNYPPHQYP